MTINMLVGADLGVRPIFCPPLRMRTIVNYPLSIVNSQFCIRSIHAIYKFFSHFFPAGVFIQTRMPIPTTFIAMNRISNGSNEISIHYCFIMLLPI